MSEKAPDVDAYVYQPDSPKRGTRRIYAIGGLPQRFTKEEAEAVVDAIKDICWMGTECHACDHVGRFDSDHCSACGTKRAAPWRGVL